MIYNPNTGQLEGKVEIPDIEYDWAKSLAEGRPVKKTEAERSRLNQLKGNTNNDK